MPKRVGILTGGGDCPGLNAAIRAVVRKLLPENIETIGILKGWKGALEKETMPLGVDEVAGILPRGGTILRTSRTNPLKHDGGLEKTVKNLEAQERVGLEMRKLVALIENYPELRSSEQFIALQAQLEGTENRINVARIRFNETVSTYNSAIRKMPGSLVAAVSNFHRKAYFEADEGADRAKKLAFD